MLGRERRVTLGSKASRLYMQLAPIASEQGRVNGIEHERVRKTQLGRSPAHEAPLEGARKVGLLAEQRRYRLHPEPLAQHGRRSEGARRVGVHIVEFEVHHGLYRLGQSCL